MAVTMVMIMIVIMISSTSRWLSSPIVPTIAITVAIRRALIARLIDPLWRMIDTADYTVSLLA
jgi:hypothetical protein